MCKLVLKSLLIVLTWVSLLEAEVIGLDSLAEDACLHIYTVPKSSVVCEADKTVRDELTNLKDSVRRLNADVETLASQMAILAQVTVEDLPQKYEGNMTNRTEPEGITHRILINALIEMQSKIKGLNRNNSSDGEHRKLVMDQLELLRSHQYDVNANLTAINNMVTELATRMAEAEQRLTQFESTRDVQIVELEKKLVAMVQHHHSEEENVTNKLIEVTHHLRTWEEQVTNDSKRISVLENKTRLVQTTGAFHQFESPDSGGQVPVVERPVQLKAILSEALHEELGLEARTKNLEVALKQLQTQMEELRKDFKKHHAKKEDREDENESVKPPQPQVQRVSDCQDIREVFTHESGVYTVFPDPGRKHSVKVFCQMTQEGIGWTIIQRRYEGGVDFYRKFPDYVQGFGSLQGEFWLGLDMIHSLTGQRPYTLQVDLQKFNGNWSFATYSDFSVGGPDTNYTLSIKGHKGTAPDAMSYHKGMPFTTHEMQGERAKCAQLAHGGWWYNDCHRANLNGRYYDTDRYFQKDGMTWVKEGDIALIPFKASVMKIRPKKITKS